MARGDEFAEREREREREREGEGEAELAFSKRAVSAVNECTAPEVPRNFNGESVCV